MSDDAEQPKKRGRPKGSKNKPKTAGNVIDFAPAKPRVKLTEEEKRKRFGKNYKPTSGPGWGGPAKGESRHTPTFDFTGKVVDHTPNEDRKAMKLRRSLEMEDIIYKIASKEEEHATVRMQAASKLYEMYNGKPVERVITDEQPIERDVIDPNELSPEAREELRAALERTIKPEVTH